MLAVNLGQQGVRRSRHSKSRKGCLRCKKRHLKCDEGRPQCQRCIKINVVCPGYNIPQARIFGLSRDECFESDFEKICFQSFTTFGNKRLLGLQPSAANFWRTIVLQLGDVYPAIRHATIAISVFQEPLVRTSVTDAMKNSSVNVQVSVLQHFNESIRLFLAYNHTFSVEAKLACCLLYYTLEVFRKNLTACAKHVRAADFILKGYMRSVANGHVLLEPAIVSDFSPLVQQQILDASTYIDNFRNDNLDCGNRYEIFQNFQLRLPQSLTDINLIYDHMATLVMYAVGCHLGDFSDPKLIQVLHDSLDRFGSTLRQISIGDTVHPLISPLHAAVLVAQHQAAVILAHTKHFNEFGFDAFISNFQIIVEAYQMFIPTLSWTDLQLPLGLIPPLFLTATRCRSIELRLEAYRLLHSMLRAEHSWTSCIASSIARMVIELEQELNRVEQSRPLRIGLQGADFSARADQISITYTVYNLQSAERSSQAYIPYNPGALSNDRIELGTMQDRALWAAGHSGVQFFSSTIGCHCMFTNSDDTVLSPGGVSQSNN